MITKTYGSTIQGIDAYITTIEANIVNGTGLYMVGLPDSAIKESQHRIESVIKSLGKNMPRRRIIINLAPASLRKEGSAYDLPIALCILQASKQENFVDLDNYMIMGELGLDGNLRPICGVLPIAIEARKKKLKGFLLPKENAPEAAIVNQLPIIPISHINDAIQFLNQEKSIPPFTINTRELFNQQKDKYTLDLQDVRGQVLAKRALEITAAGGHNLLMIGPPGGGKTMLAKRLVSILPPAMLREALEITKIYSVKGELRKTKTLITERPFRTPHHTISQVALAGGGPIPQPGEISLAHNGILFLDELPEFKRAALEVLRQPLEEKHITITRTKMSVEFPANFTLIASMNPCPCGYYTHPQKSCVCSPLTRRRYLNKISGPLLDRIDLHIEVTPLDFNQMNSETTPITSQSIRKNVVKARELQKERFTNYPKIYCNGMMPPPLLKKICLLSKASRKLLEKAIEKLHLSARAYDKIIKIARTIADLDGSISIAEKHLAEAIYFRSLDREKWAG